MPTYICPTCGETMERELLLFVRHTNVHIEAELARQEQEQKRRAAFHLSARLRELFPAISIESFRVNFRRRYSQCQA